MTENVNEAPAEDDLVDETPAELGDDAGVDEHGDELADDEG